MLTINYYNDFFELGQQKINFSFFELTRLKKQVYYVRKGDNYYELRKLFSTME